MQHVYKKALLNIYFLPFPSVSFKRIISHPTPCSQNRIPGPSDSNLIFQARKKANSDSTGLHEDFSLLGMDFSFAVI